jgi:hypothetical protein
MNGLYLHQLSPLTDNLDPNHLVDALWRQRSFSLDVASFAVLKFKISTPKGCPLYCKSIINLIIDKSSSKNNNKLELLAVSNDDGDVIDMKVETMRKYYKKK